MGLIVGPTTWWQNSLITICPVGSTLPDNSRIICKAGGTAWIVAPTATQVFSQWAGGQYNSTLVGNKCCVSEWPALNSRLIQCGFNPVDWFVPSELQLTNPGFVCRNQWDTYLANSYWSSTENTANNACNRRIGDNIPLSSCKNISLPVRVFRCVTY